MDVRLLPDPGDGVARTVALTVAGQQIASVFVDCYGLLGLTQRGVSALGLAGVGLLVGGLARIRVG